VEFHEIFEIFKKKKSKVDVEYNSDVNRNELKLIQSMFEKKTYRKYFRVTVQCTHIRNIQICSDILTINLIFVFTWEGLNVIKMIYSLYYTQGDNICFFLGNKK